MPLECEEGWRGGGALRKQYPFTPTVDEHALNPNDVFGLARVQCEDIKFVPWNAILPSIGKFCDERPTITKFEITM